VSRPPERKNVGAIGGQYRRDPRVARRNPRKCRNSDEILLAENLSSIQLSSGQV